MSFVYGSSLYNTLIYSESDARYTFIGDKPYDFKVNWISKLTGNTIGNVTWELYKRDYTLGTEVLVDEGHTLVDSGTFNNSLTILLSNYGDTTRFTDTDYYLKTSKNSQWVNHTNSFYIQYYASRYGAETRSTPYTITDVRVAEDRGTSTASPPRTIIKERPQPIVRIKRITTKEDEEVDVILLKIEEVNV